MTQALVETRIDSRRVAYVTVRRPEKLNALSREVMAQFCAAFARLTDAAPVRAVVLTGEGKAFIGGADIGELGGLDQDTARDFILRVHACCEAVRSFPAPVIARLNGYALGAGLEVAAACDLRAAAETAVFGMPEVLLGVPSVVEAAILPRLTSGGRAREVLLLGKTFTAQEALAWGLVERTAAADDLDGVVEGWIDDILACGPDALRLQKALMRRWDNLPLDEAVAAGVEAFAAAFQGEEPARMISAFQARRRG